jgi:O-antigen/teichoic acid export membrane protein
MKRGAIGAIGAQGAQAFASFVLQILVARTLGFTGLGRFAILYGVIVLASGVITGFVGDSLVVLDRHHKPVRSALQQFALALALATGLVAGLVVFAIGLVDGVEAILFGLAIVAFCLEELIRRMLMAQVTFWRVAAIDFLGFLVALGVIGVFALTGTLTLSAYLAGLFVGQTVALLAGVPLLPKKERYLVAFERGGYGTVAGYGIWRSLQQLLRPAMLTVARTLVTLFVGLAATGRLEAARTYTAPALLVISGLSSFLFVSFAKQQGQPVRSMLRRADKAVGALLLGTVVIGIIALVALPFVGPILFPKAPDVAAVIGWLLYTASVAAVTPYGALAALSGKQAVVFGVRLSDTLFSLITVSVVLLLLVPSSFTAMALSLGSILGGLAIRFFILVPLRRRDDRERAKPADPELG